MFAKVKERQQAGLSARLDAQAQTATARAVKFGLDTTDAVLCVQTLDSSASIGGWTDGPGVCVLLPDRVTVAAKPPARSVATRVMRLGQVVGVDVTAGRVFATVTLTGAGTVLQVKLGVHEAARLAEEVQARM